jgi:hypothetical protein
MGVQEMTRFGMKENDFSELADYVVDVIIRNINVKEKIKIFRKKFGGMQYCLPIEETAPFAAKILASIFPEKEFFKKFVDNLQEIAKVL